MNSVPDWMLKHIQNARELFGVGGSEWHVIVRLSDKPMGDEQCDGAVTTDTVYMNATIEMQETLVDDELARSSIYHEVLHIPHEEIDHLVRRIIGELPKDAQDRYHDLYKEQVEHFVQKISRSVCARLKPEAT